MRITILIRASAAHLMKKARALRTPLGGACMIVFLMLLLGTPAVAHAGIGSWILDGLGWVADNTFGMAFAGLSYAILAFSNLILFLVGVLFNFVIDHTVFTFATLFGDRNSGLIIAWKILRDVANIALLFGFIFIGIMTMLDSHSYEMKKTLPRLIIFAILMNFSLLASQAVIDTANVFSSVLYSQAGGLDCGAGKDYSKGECTTVGISGKVLQMTGVAKIFDETDSSTQSTESSSWTKDAIVYLCMSIFVTVVAVVLLAGAIMLIIRAVVLVFLMILSPLGFAGFAIPPLEKYAQDWWHRLLSQSFFAPVYLLLIFVGLKVGEGLQEQLGGASLVSALKYGNVDAVQAVLLFTIIVGFMVAALMAAKQMGAMGANFAMQAAQKVVSYPYMLANRGAFGVPGIAAAASWGARRWESGMGRLYQGGKASRLLANTLYGLNIDDGVRAGLKGITTAKVGGYRSYVEEGKHKAENRNEAIHAQEKAVRDAKLKAAGAVLANPKSSGADKDDARKLINELTQKMSIHDLEAAIRDGTKEQVAAISQALSPEKFGKLLESKELLDDKKHDMQNARFADLVKAIDTGLTQSEEQMVKDLSAKDLELLAKTDPARFGQLLGSKKTNGRSYVTEDVLEKLSKSDGLSADHRRVAKENTIVGRVERIIDSEGAGAGAQLVLASKMKPKQKAELSAEHLVQIASVGAINQADLQAFINKGDLGGGDMKQVVDNALSSPAPRGDTAEDQQRRREHQQRIEGIRNALENSDFLRAAYGQPKPRAQASPAAGEGGYGEPII